MENVVMTVVVAASIPSALTGFFFWIIQRQIEKREKERDEKDAVREKNELLLIKVAGASLALGEATAAAVQRIPDAKCNGDMHAALDYARQVKHEQKDLLFETAVKNMI